MSFQEPFEEIASETQEAAQDELNEALEGVSGEGVIEWIKEKVFGFFGS